MAKFLDTTGVSYHLQQLINSANEKLILISPYLKVSDRLKQSLEDKDRMKIDIRIIYGKNELEPAEHNWLKSLRSIRTSFCQNLHAKCYLNEKEAIITSMNLYDFSQINNNEMGIYVDKNSDPELFSSISEEAMRLVRISDEIKITVAQVPKNAEKVVRPPPSTHGYCIRCKTEIKLNPMSPYCGKCYASWKKFENDEYVEKFCHICGKPNNSSLIKPSCFECYKVKKEVLEFPLQ
ncbi:MAG: phospholipase D family protein [Chloroflexi bacterium]|nr:phospholipase D family protein [Chloroflexota bacterium]